MNSLEAPKFNNTGSNASVDDAQTKTQSTLKRRNAVRGQSPSAGPLAQLAKLGHYAASESRLAMPVSGEVVSHKVCFGVAPPVKPKHAEVITPLRKNPTSPDNDSSSIDVTTASAIVVDGGDKAMRIKEQLAEGVDVEGLKRQSIESANSPQLLRQLGTRILAARGTLRKNYERLLQHFGSDNASRPEQGGSGANDYWKMNTRFQIMQSFQQINQQLNDLLGRSVESLAELAKQGAHELSK